jgi:hypothetical protein
MVHRALLPATVLAALVTAALLPATALGAKPWLHFEAKPVKPGARVHAWTATYTGTCCNAMQLYLVPATVAKAGTGKPTATGAVQIGRINWHHGRGLGTSDFVVPKVKAGRYRIVAFCRKCAPP